MSEPVFPIRIEVGYDIGLLSPNKRLCPAVRRERQRDSALAARAAYRRTGSPVSNLPVNVEIIVLRARLLDQDNATSALKWILDSLFNRTRNREGITPSDSPRWVRLGPVQQVCEPKWGGLETVVLWIEAREEE